LTHAHPGQAARPQKRFLRAVEARPLARDRAIGRLLFYSGVRVDELVSLDEGDVPLSARKGKVIVREGKGGDSREIPLLDPTARDAVARWEKERAGWPQAPENPALFLNRRGGRLSAARLTSSSTPWPRPPTWSTTTARRPPQRTRSATPSAPTCCATASTLSPSPN
jgi:site-specific recombinase XerC